MAETQAPEPVKGVETTDVSMTEKNIEKSSEASKVGTANESKDNSQAAPSEANGSTKADDSESPNKSNGAESAKSNKNGTKNAKKFNENRGHRKGIKAEFDHLPETDDPDEIRKQVEFYFSDSNLPRDKFLFNKTEGHKNKPIAIRVIAEFKRMQRFKPFTAIVAALRESSLVEVVEDDLVRRKEPLPEIVGTEFRVGGTGEKLYEDKTMPRSVYVKGFDDKETKTTQIDLEKWFNTFGPVQAVRLRRFNHDKAFKGSVFVEFKSEESQRAFLALDPKPKYNDAELKIMSKKDYCDSKIKEKIERGDLKPEDLWKNNKQSRGGHRGGRGNQGGRGQRGGRGRGGRRDDRRDDRRDNRRDDRRNDRSNENKEEDKPIEKALATDGDVASRKMEVDKPQVSEEKRGTKRAAEDDGGEKESKKVKEDA